MNAEQLKAVLAAHRPWLADGGGKCANLRRVNLRDADLCSADLCNANLCGTNLCGANLCGANLRDADLCNANLCGANLCNANLCNANLRRANLRDADLRYANLCNTDLRGTVGNGVQIITVQTTKWHVVYTADVMAIGCQQYNLAAWWVFDDAAISSMDPDALEWWRVHKPILQALIAANPAEPTNGSGTH